MGYDKGPDRISVNRPLIVMAALALFVFGAAKAGFSYFAKGYASAPNGRVLAIANENRPTGPIMRRHFNPRPAGTPDGGPPGSGHDVIVPAKNTIVVPVGQAQAFAAAINAAANANISGAAVDANASVNANAQGAAIHAVGQQAAEVAKSAELHQATVSLWTSAWQKSWPFIKDMTVKFFGLFRTLWDSLKNVGKNSGGGADLNAAVNANAATNANAAQ